MNKEIKLEDVKNFKDIRILSRKIKLFFDKEIKPQQSFFNREYKKVAELVRIVQWTRKKRRSSMLNNLDFWIHCFSREGFFYMLKMLFLGGEKQAFSALAGDYWKLKYDRRTLNLLEDMVDLLSEEAERIYFNKDLDEENKYAKFYESLTQAKFLHEELIAIKDEIDEMREYETKVE
jgi:hypothetical protein